MLVPAISKLIWANIAPLLRMPEGTTTLTVDDPPALTLGGVAEQVRAVSSAVDAGWPEASVVDKKLLQPRVMEPVNPPMAVVLTVKLTV